MVIHKYYSLFILVFLLSIYIFNNFFYSFKEGFTWSKQTVNDFLKYQKTVDTNNHQYDMNMVQQQASEDEAKELLAHGYWPWSDKTKYLYLDAVSKAPIINIDPAEDLDYAIKIYNEEAIKRLTKLYSNFAVYSIKSAMHIIAKIKNKYI